MAVSSDILDLSGRENFITTLSMAYCLLPPHAVGPFLSHMLCTLPIAGPATATLLLLPGWFCTMPLLLPSAYLLSHMSLPLHYFFYPTSSLPTLCQLFTLFSLLLYQTNK